MFKVINDALKNNGFKSINLVKTHNGDVIQLIIDDNIDTIELKKRELPNSSDNAVLEQRVSILEIDQTMISKAALRGIDVITEVEGLARIVDSEAEFNRTDTEYYGQAATWIDGIPSLTFTNSKTFNFTLSDDLKQATSKPVFIVLTQPYTINWYSKNEADRYALLEGQKVEFNVDVSDNGKDWVFVGKKSEEIPKHYFTKTHDKGNSFYLKYKTQFHFEGIEAKFIRITTKRNIEEFYLTATELSSSWTYPYNLCGLCPLEYILPKVQTSLMIPVLQEFLMERTPIQRVIIVLLCVVVCLCDIVCYCCVVLLLSIRNKYLIFINCGVSYFPKTYDQCQKIVNAPLFSQTTSLKYKQEQCVSTRLPIQIDYIRAMYLVHNRN
ncbi:hypothetical protein ABK040_004222 [Willaertia magna]